MKKPIILLLLACILSLSSCSQQKIFDHQDTLRGSITPEREWWDLTYYHLDIVVNPVARTIGGTNTIMYTVLKPGTVMQIDMQEPMSLTKAEQNGYTLEIKRDGNACFITLAEEQIAGKNYSLKVTYQGSPHESKHAPWEGGITWKEDKDDNYFIASACQGDGASLWWPCKDHMYDEPDSMLISVNVPADLVDVSNGRLRAVDTLENNTRTFHWFVSNPISNYSVNINIGNYTSFSEKYEGEKGVLDCDFWVLKYDLDVARVHFKQALDMIKAFEYWFGPYPFYEDSYKLVEAPYLGMEHQSCVTYGNKFKNGYLGKDLSGTGWGLKFDFIIIHESGHEWFANNITYQDIADMWVHESFANYSECLFVEYYYGKEAGYEYVRGTRENIRNDRPIIGIYNVNYAGSGDMYYKGGNMLHTLRQIVNDDEKWRQILRGINLDFYHQTVTGKQVEDYLSEKTGMDLKPFFDQYLRDTRIPVFEYSISKNKLNFRWKDCVPEFKMPVEVVIDGEKMLLEPATEWKSILLKNTIVKVEAAPDYYVLVSAVKGEV